MPVSPRDEMRRGSRPVPLRTESPGTPLLSCEHSHGAGCKVRVLVLDLPIQGNAPPLAVVGQQGHQCQRRGQRAVWRHFFSAGRKSGEELWLIALMARKLPSIPGAPLCHQARPRIQVPCVSSERWFRCLHICLTSGRALLTSQNGLPAALQHFLTSLGLP